MRFCARSVLFVNLRSCVLTCCLCEVFVCVMCYYVCNVCCVIVIVGVLMCVLMCAW